MAERAAGTRPRAVQTATPPPPVPGRLAPPSPRADTVERPRLLQRLRAAGDSPVVVVRAPAGYGKTTLLGQLLAAERRPAVWLAVDPRDGDPVVLVHDLCHSLEGVGVDVDEVRGALVAGTRSVLPRALPRLIAALAARFEPLLIVLDDVHHLDGAASADVLQALCDGAPAGCTVVLSGRSRPAIRLGRLRAQGRLWEVKLPDLRMTAAEGAAMLRAAGADLDDEEAAVVVNRTEGWPAALYLAAILLRDADGEAGPGEPGPDPRHMADYFREEILDQMPAEDAEFLIRTSVLEELRPAICNATLAVDDAGERLQSLADANLFISAGDTHGTTFRMHGLFRSMLRERLRFESPALEKQLHRRACVAWEEAGGWDHAVRHAVEADEPGLAAELIWKLAPEYISHGRGTTVSRWAALLTEDELRSHPQIALVIGWAAVEVGDGDRASLCASVVLGMPDATLADGTALHAQARLLRACVGGHGTEAAREDAAAAAAAQHGGWQGGLALTVLGMLELLAGDAGAAREMLVAGEIHSAGVLPTAYVLSLTHQALLAVDDGAWDEAERLLGRALTFQRGAGIEAYASQAIVAAVRALTLANSGDRDAARVFADAAHRGSAAGADVIPWLGLETRLVLARARTALGDAAQARELLRECDALLDSHGTELLRRRREQIGADVELLSQSGPGGPLLTTAELRTLQYLPTHLSLREIGERLYITRNTVKTHTIAIYRKLGATSRSEAVTRGRELGLLDG